MQRAIQRPIYRAIQSGLLTLPGGFSPISLFSASDKGYIYDNNDLTGFYLDSTAWTPATVNGLVGLQLDKSGGLTRGAELITNGDFSSGATGWTLTASATVTGGALSVNSVAFENFAVSTVTVPNVAGLYYLEFDATVTSGQFGVFVSQVSANNKFTNANITTSGRKSGYVMVTNPVGSGNAILFRSEGAFVGTIDNVTVKAVSGNHRYQSTTGSKPILRGSPVGANLVTNGDFASGTGWTTGAGWAIGSGVATATTSSGTLTSTLTATASKYYRVTYTVTRSAGSVQVSFGGRTGVSRSAAGTYVDYLDNTTNTNALVFTGTGFSGTLDNIEVVDVSADAVTAPYGLQYDGIDDFLTTASVDFTATDKMAVVMGVRKLSDAAVGCLVETGTNRTLAGAFGIRAPTGAGVGNYDVGATGAVGFGQGTTPTSFAAPRTDVVSAQINIGALGYAGLGPFRVNASQQTLSFSGAGVGTVGNFGNYAIFFGRTGGTILPLNGLDFGGGCINKTLTATQLSQFERWVAQRTGVTL